MTKSSHVVTALHHNVAHLHLLSNVPTMYQLPTPYGLGDIARTRFYRSRSLQQGHLHPLTNVPTKYQVPMYTLQFLRYSLDKILWVKVTTARSKVKSRSHHDIAHLHPLINIPTKYQLSTPYGFCDTARKILSC